MSALTSVLNTALERFKLWREHHRAFAELDALDDHALADLGLRRSDIPFVVYGRTRDRDVPAAPLAANSNDGRRAA
ncbi:MAG: DUF1127 domain-containing protein [Alphaproteobacteria bacterium]|nr:DUF1127 domain-containing protein [Alphaproteobacteria bacterium]